MMWPIILACRWSRSMLGLFDERQRQEFLRLHLANVILMLAGMEELKEKIKLNGHFKNLGGFDW
jgi:uncharacterized protein